VSPVICR